MGILKLVKRLDKRTKDVTRTLSLFDPHAPIQQEDAIKAILKLVPDIQFDEILGGGDWMELDEISRWTKGKPRITEGKRLINTFRSGKELLLRFLDKLPKNVQKTFLMGNHEDWIEQYLDEHPGLEGLIGVKEGLELDKLGFKVQPLNLPLIRGKVKIIHGQYTGAHHAHQTVQKYKCNVIYGHAHTYQAHAAECYDNFYSAISTPCLCRLDKAWLDHKPTNWCHGFGILDTFKDGWNYQVITIVRGKFSYDGKIYRGR